MFKAIVFLRSVVFAIVFYSLTVPLLCVTLAMTKVGRRPFFAAATAWSFLHRYCARWITGQRIVIEGDLPQGLYFYVLKHESLFETIDLPCLLRLPVVVAKRELLDMPLWGRLARTYGLLAVDREAGAAALRRMRTETQAALATGRPICLFPEGTRVDHGERPPLKSGFAGLYVILQRPVVPIAVLSGPINPRGFMRYPGIVRYRIGEIIPAGLPRREAEARAHAAINALNS